MRVGEEKKELILPLLSLSLPLSLPIPQVPIRSWALQCYNNVLLLISPISASEVPNLDPDGNLLGHFFAAISSFALSRDSMKRLLRPRGSEKKKEHEMRMWIKRVEKLDEEQAEELERKMDEGWEGRPIALTQANQISQTQLEEIGGEFESFSSREDDRADYPPFRSFPPVFMDSLEEEDED